STLRSGGGSSHPPIGGTASVDGWTHLHRSVEVDELVGALRSGHNRVMPRTDSSLPLSQWAPLAPVGLLLLSQAAGWLSVTRLLPLESMLASIPLTLVLLVARLVMIRLG